MYRVTFSFSVTITADYCILLVPLVNSHCSMTCEGKEKKGIVRTLGLDVFTRFGAKVVVKVILSQ